MTAPAPTRWDSPTQLDLVDPELYATGDPYAMWRWLRHNHPVYWHEPRHGLPGFWAVTKYEDIATIFDRPDRFSSAEGILLRPTDHGRDPGGGRMLALTDPPRHRRLRAALQPWFTERAVRSLGPAMHDIVTDILDRAIELGSCDLVNDIAARLPLYVICRLLGVPDKDRERLFTLSTRAFGADQASAQRMAHVELMGYFAGQAELRRHRPGNDILSALATMELDGVALTEQELIFNCDNVLVGGTENVRIAAAGGLFEFVTDPSQWERLRGSPEAIPTAVEEVLRWTCSPTHILRTAVADATVHGAEISAGDRLVLWLPSANRDEEVFDNPDTFDIRRSPNRHIAFGHAEHFCLGATLARAELRLLLSEMTRRIAAIRLAAAPVMLRSIVVHGPQSVLVELSPA